MKRIVPRAAGFRSRRRFPSILSTVRAYFILSLCSMAVFIVLGLAGILQRSYAVSPVQSMKGFAASLSGQFFESLLGMELPHMQTDPDSSPFQTGKMAVFLFRFLTDLNPNDPKSLLALEMPGMSPDRSVLLRPGSGGQVEAPEDREPLSVELAAPHEEDASAPPADPAPPVSEPESRDTGGSKVVFIYHSHNRESWLPELKPGTKDPNDARINVTLVGKRLAEQLEEKGVGAAHSSKDYASSVQSYNWNLSYKYSQKTVQQAMADYRDLQYFIDIHRDSQRRSKTTATIKGVDYAQVYFIIGHKNPNWKRNEEFAGKIHERLEQNYPGLSRGIWGKTAANGNGEYNQSLDPDSVLIEIGGIENTLEECYRTADALAEVISDLYWESRDAEKVNGSLSRNPVQEASGVQAGG